MIQSEKILFNSILKYPDILEKLNGIDGNFFTSPRNNKILKLIKTGKNTVLEITAAFPEIDQPEINTYLNKCFANIYEIPISQLQKAVNEILKKKLESKIVKLINDERKTGVYDFDKILDYRFQIEDLNNNNKPDYLNLKNVDPKAINWLWYNKFPAGSISLLAGDPGAGKSMLALWIAARISRGEDWPDIAGNPAGSVIILSAEDNIEDTLRVRADEAGADCKKIFILNPKKFNLEEIKGELEYLIKEIPDIKLIIIDPLDAYMTGTKGNENIGLRTALIPLLQLAAFHKISVLAVHHLNKDSAKKAIYRPLGSIAYQGVPRSSWVVERDPEDKENKRRFFAPLKTNLSKNPTTLAFRIDGPIGRPAIEFEPDPIEIDTNEILGDEETKDNYTARADAVDWIKKALKDGPVEAATIKKDSKENMIAEATLNRAKKSAGVNSYQKEKKWFWELRK